MVSIKAPLFSCPSTVRAFLHDWKTLVFPSVRGRRHTEGKKSPLGFLFLCGGSFRDVDLCERAFSRRHQFDVYCIKRGRAWPRENIKASSISWKKKKKSLNENSLHTNDDNGWESPAFFLTSGYRSAPLKGNHSRSISVDFIIFFIVGYGVW